MTDRILRDPVPPELTAFAVEIRDDHDRFRVGYEEERTIGGRLIVAKVEWHTYRGATGETFPQPRPGVTLYERTPDTMPSPVSSPDTRLQAIGIDLSHYQRGADLARVAAAGYSFAICKASEGLTDTDDAYAEHVTRARGAGLLVGAYHFFRGARPAIAQVRRFVELAGSVDLPLALDFEWQSASAPLGGLTAAEYADAIAEAVHELATLTGRRPLVYTAAGWWSLVAERIDPAVYVEADLWVASYTSKPAPTMPPGWPGWRIWQHSDKALTPGVSGLGDVNRYNGSVADLRAWALGPPPDATDAGRILEIAREVDEGREGLG